jgi:diguanylate cyclase (GGDEF)-like protein/PAS domain S-box-containing protein
LPVLLFSGLATMAAAACLASATPALGLGLDLGLDHQAVGLPALAVLAVLVLGGGIIVAARELQSRSAVQSEPADGKHHLRTAIDHMPQGLTMFDGDHRLAVVNDRYIAMYNLSPDVVKPGLPFRALIHHRKERDTFRGNVDKHCEAVSDSLRRGVQATVLTEPVPGRFINVVIKPVAGGGWVATHEDVTEHQKLLRAQAVADQKLRDQKIQLDAALNNMMQGLCMYDAQGRVVLFNKRYAFLRNHDPETLLGRSFLQLLREASARGDTKADPDQLFASCVVSAARGETTTKTIEAGGRMIRIVDTPVPEGGWVSTFEDVTERTRLEAERDRSRDFLDLIVDHVPSTIYVKRASDRQYVLVNHAGERFWGIPREQMLGKTCFDVFPAKEAANIESRDDDLMRTRRPVFDEREILTPLDGIRSISARRLIISDKQGDAEYILGVVDDITERRASDARIALLAHFDTLTGLPNRTLFCEQLDNRLRNLQSGEKLAVLYLDLDHFKSVNDTLGHAKGDELLCGVAARLRGRLAETDVLARLSGDEFAIVLNAADPHRTLQERVHALRQAVVKEPLSLGGHMAIVDLSIGIALAPDHGTTVTDLLKHADLALYSAKLEGRATHRFYEPDMNARMTLRRNLEMDLRQAISAGQFDVHYQPIVKVQDRIITGCEALIRWQRPDRGWVSPAEFIPLAEEMGLIAEIGEFVLRRACHDAVTWPEHTKVAVNVSPVQFRNPEFPALVMRCLRETGLSPGRLELELTESVLMQSTEATLNILRELQQSGIRISLDDFGTGYSSLSYLRRFSFNRIKIDRSFVTDIATRPDALAIVRTILMLADSLGMTTTAEGVETDDQQTLLRAIGCQEMQGFLVSPAIPFSDASRLLRHGVRRSAAA